MHIDNSHGCDIVFFRKKVTSPLIYLKTIFAFRPSYNAIAIKLEDEQTVLVRASGGYKYNLVDEWQYVGDRDEDGNRGKYFTYSCRSENSSPQNWRGKDPITGKHMWMRFKTHKIIDL